MISKFAIATLLGCTACLNPASAASTAWHETAGGRVRLVSSGPLDNKGELRAALQIELKPGWKTYWRDPGASGVPPQVDLPQTGDWASATLEYPAPQWHKDDYGSWAGYDHSVSFPVTFTAAEGKVPAAVQATTFLGICQTICVPLQADLSLTVDTTSTPADESNVVEAAWAALPHAASDTMSVTSTSTDATGALVVNVASPSLPVELFVAGVKGYVLAPPERKGDRDFVIKVISRPKVGGEGADLPYTLRSPDGSVSGTIPQRDQ